MIIPTLVRYINALGDQLSVESPDPIEADTIINAASTSSKIWAFVKTSICNDDIYQDTNFAQILLAKFVILYICKLLKFLAKAEKLVIIVPASDESRDSKPGR